MLRRHQICRSQHCSKWQIVRATGFRDKGYTIVFNSHLAAPVMKSRGGGLTRLSRHDYLVCSATISAHKSSVMLPFERKLVSYVIAFSSHSNLRRFDVMHLDAAGWALRTVW